MPTMKRDDYKAVKHMNKDQLTVYLQRVYRRGFEAGVASIVSELKKDIPPLAPLKSAPDISNTES